MGNWRSWFGKVKLGKRELGREMVWKAGDRKVTAEDLLHRTVLYKVGHHGSHNATLREQGLELMGRSDGTGELVAFLPVDEHVAREQAHYGEMPLRPAKEFLDKSTDLYFEHTVAPPRQARLLQYLHGVRGLEKDYGGKCMKLQRISFLAALVAALVLTGCGSSGIGDILGGGTRTSDPYDQNINNVRGTVERVNTAEQYIVVDAEETTSNLRNGDSEIVLYYDDRTTVEHQGRTYKPADLEAGDRILADVNQSGSRLLAEEIQVLYDVTSGTGDDQYGNGDRYGDTRTQELRGTVRYVDTRDQTLELEPSTGRTGVVVVHYDSSTRVEFEGRQYKPENLERGDRVEIEVRELNGRMIAEEILVVGEAASR